MESAVSEVAVESNQPVELIKTETSKLNEIDISGEIILPKIEDLPESYRDKSKQNVELLNSSLQKFTLLEPRVDQFTQIVDGVIHDFGLIASEEADSEASEKMAEGLKEKLRIELETLSKARSLLLDGKDATGVLQVDREFELYKYGKAKNPVQWLQQFQWKQKPDYQKGKQDFIDYQWVLFNQKAGGLTEIVRQFAGENPETISMPSASGWNLESSDFSNKATIFEQDCKTKADEYREQHKNTANLKAALQTVEKWLDEDWNKEINLASKWDTGPVGLNKLKEAIDYQTRKMDEAGKNVAIQIEGYSYNSRAYKGALLGQALELGDKISESVYERKFNFSSQEKSVSGKERESYIPLLPYCGTSLEEYKAIASLSTWLDEYTRKSGIELNPGKEKLGQIKKALEALSEANKEFPDSKDLMWHGANTDNLISRVIIPGFVLARAEQMKMFGEANFASANMKVRKLAEDSYELTQDFFPYSTSVKTLTKDELSKEYGSGSKQWFEEYNQVCFERNFSYFGDNLDMALCFSKSSLLANKQFMLADGWHIFDEEYQGNPESSGLKVNLNEEPHLLVVVKETYLPTLREKLNTTSKDGKILGGSIGVDEWIDKHTIIVSSMTEQETRDRIQNEFFKRFKPKRQAGFFMPSGISAPELPGVKVKQPLVTYKTM